MVKIYAVNFIGNLRTKLLSKVNGELQGDVIKFGINPNWRKAMAKEYEKEDEPKQYEPPETKPKQPQRPEEPYDPKQPWKGPQPGTEPKKEQEEPKPKPGGY